MLKNFIRGYIACALWSSTDDKDKPLDDNYDENDFSPEAMKIIAKDCTEFYTTYLEMLEKYVGQVTESDGDHWATAGHDFWLTRNNHGCGYWDRDGLSDGVSGALTTFAHEAGERYIYVGDDGMLHMA